MLFQLPNITLIGQVDDIYKKEKEHSPSRTSAPASSNESELLDSYFSTRDQSINKFSKEIDDNEQTQLDSIVIQLKDQNPNSYEYHYVNYVNSNYDVNAFSELEKANEISPNNVELYDEFIAHYEITNNTIKKKAYCQQLYESNIIPDGVLEYNQNVLNSLEPNAILFTNGSDDTYPAWIHQEVKNIREDVTILNLDLLSNQQYKKDKFSQNGLIETSCPVSDIIYQTSIHNPKQPIYIGLTVSPNILLKLKNNLYLTGLAFKYSTNDYNNVPEIVSNWEHLFNYEQLTKPVTNNTVKQINLNYILPLIIIRDHYINTNQIEKKEKTEKLIIKIAKEGNKENQVQKYLKN
jgi:hypothetical protein